MIPKIFSILFLVAFLSGCMQNNTDKDTTIFKFKDYSYDMLAKSDDVDAEDFFIGDGSLHVYGSLILPVKINENNITELRDSIIRCANVGFDKDGKVVPKLEEGYYVVDEDPAQAEPSTELYNSIFIDLINSKLIVWEESLYSYMGGAHGYGVSRYINYSISLNKILSLDDLFNPGFENKLNDIIREKLKWEYSDAVYDPDKLDDISYSEIFRVKTSGIDFIYDPYVIGPYSSGTITVEVYLSQLEEEGLLKPRVTDLIF